MILSSPFSQRSGSTRQFITNVWRLVHSLGTDTRQETVFTPPTDSTEVEGPGDHASDDDLPSAATAALKELSKPGKSEPQHADWGLDGSSISHVINKTTPATASTDDEDGTDQAVLDDDLPAAVTPVLKGLSIPTKAKSQCEDSDIDAPPVSRVSKKAKVKSTRKCQPGVPTRQRSSRQQGRTPLSYNQSYHPLDEVTRPAHAAKLKEQDTKLSAKNKMFLNDGGPSKVKGPSARERLRRSSSSDSPTSDFDTPDYDSNDEEEPEVVETPQSKVRQLSPDQGNLHRQRPSRKAAQVEVNYNMKYVGNKIRSYPGFKSIQSLIKLQSSSVL